MTALVVIPARGGSKGIPRKNLLEVGGKPLIAWTIAQALEARADEPDLIVAVSAADAEIAEVGAIGGDGGVIVMGKDGVHAFSMNTSGMYRGAVSSSEPARVAIYADEER